MASTIPAHSNFDSLVAYILPQGSIVHFRKNQTIFAHGERSHSIFYIQHGYIKLTVISTSAKEAVIGIFDRGEFFGESCIASNHPVRFHNAIALTDVQAVEINRKVIMSVLLAGGKFASALVSYLLRRNEDIQQAFTDTLLLSSAARLAAIRSSIRSRARAKDQPVPMLNQQTLAEMLGITRQRVNFLSRLAPR
ncbi:MAG: Crp/Fnr family transcriptional regulator [Terriglobales bacterium]